MFAKRQLSFKVQMKLMKGNIDNNRETNEKNSCCLFGYSNCEKHQKHLQNQREKERNNSYKKQLKKNQYD